MVVLAVLLLKLEEMEVLVAGPVVLRVPVVLAIRLRAIMAEAVSAAPQMKVAGEVVAQMRPLERVAMELPPQAVMAALALPQVYLERL